MPITESARVSQNSADKAQQSSEKVETFAGGLSDAAAQFSVADPRAAPITPAQVLALQRASGNRAVSNLLRKRLAPASAPSVGRLAPFTIQRVTYDSALLRDPQGMMRDITADALLDLKDQYAYRYAYQSLKPAEIKSLNIEVLREKLAAAALETRNTPHTLSDPDANAVLTTFIEKINAAAYDNTLAAAVATYEVYKANAAQAQLTSNLFRSLQENFVKKVRDKYKRLDKELEIRLGHKGTEAGKIPDPAEKQRFADVLRTLPGLKEIIADTQASFQKDSGPHGTGAVRGSTMGGGGAGDFTSRSQLGASGVTWKNKKNLVDQIQTPHTPGNIATDSIPTPAQIADGLKKLKTDLQNADNFYRTLVEPAVLKKIDAPKIVYHLVNSSDRFPGGADPSGKETYTANQDGDKVHFASGDEREIIIHEIGHYVEDQMPRENWLDIQSLMRARHAQAGGGDKMEKDAGDTYARMKGDYPGMAGFAPYTSKTYQTATEVTSMTMQYLSKVGDIQNLIDNDPTIVATVLRALRPSDYQKFTALREFDKYLP